MPGYLDQYGAGEEKRNKIILRTIATSVAVIALTALSWFLFKNHHQEGVVKAFIGAVRSGDYQGAYRIWGCKTPQDCSGYPYDKFMGDWGSAKANPDGQPDLSVLSITDSESCNNGVLLTVEVNRARNEKLWVDKSSDAISYAPYAICPHKNPWAIMMQRTVGQLRKPLLK